MGYCWSFFLRYLSCWFLIIFEGRLSLLMDILPLSTEEKKLQNAAKGMSVLIWCLKSLMRFLVHGSFLMPVNKVLWAGFYKVKPSDASHACIAKDEAEVSIFSIPVCITQQQLVLESHTNYDLKERVRWCVLAFWSISLPVSWPVFHCTNFSISRFKKEMHVT